MKLSAKQKEVIKEMRGLPHTYLKLSYNRKLPTACVNSLLKNRLVNYNDRYDGIILTELGKTIDL